MPASPGLVLATDAALAAAGAWDGDAPMTFFDPVAQQGPFDQSVGSFYELDTQVQLNAQFSLAANGAPADPTNVLLLVMTPTGSQLSYSYALGQVVRSGVGAYSFALATGQPGQWLYRWQGIGAVVASSRDVPLNVKPSSFSLAQIVVPSAGGLVFTGGAPIVTGAA